MYHNIYHHIHISTNRCLRSAFARGQSITNQYHPTPLNEGFAISMTVCESKSTRCVRAYHLSKLRYHRECYHMLPSCNQTWLAGKWTIEIGDVPIF